MKECKFGIEASFGIPFNYENGYESMTIELTDEQFERYCHALGHWRTTEEWRSRNDDNGHDYFIKEICRIFGRCFGISWLRWLH